ncbi:MAG: tetratricopeptide repeat protein [Acidobacteriota bacterium]
MKKIFKGFVKPDILVIFLINFIVLTNLLLLSCAVQTTKELGFKKEDAQVHFKMAEDYYNRGEYSNAIKEYKIVEQIDPNFPNIHMALGSSYIQIAWYERAEEELLKQKALTPQNINVYLNLGVAYKNLKKYEDSLNMYLKVIEINPEYADAYYNMGILCLENLNLLEQAIYYFKRFIALAPHDERAIKLKKWIEEQEKINKRLGQFIEDCNIMSYADRVFVIPAKAGIQRKGAGFPFSRE